MTTALLMTTPAVASAHRQFEAALPVIHGVARRAFRTCRPQDREDLIAEATAAAWSAWSGLIRRGKDPVQVGVSGIARFAVRSTRHGRRLGNTRVGGARRDLMHAWTQQACNIKVISLDESTATTPWRELLLSDPRVNVARQAAFRVDFAAWLGALEPRTRAIAAALARGTPTGEAAADFGVSPGRISQLRRELESSWRAFQAGVVTARDEHDEHASVPSHSEASRRDDLADPGRGGVRPSPRP